MRLSFLVCLLSCTYSFIIADEPWGKDADLCQISQKKTDSLSCSTPILGGISESLIGFHQSIISPADGPRSHFIPSSSQYTLDAMRNYGFLQGFLMGCDRLMRENSEEWVYKCTVNGVGHKMKWDPVK